MMTIICAILAAFMAGELGTSVVRFASGRVDPASISAQEIDVRYACFDYRDSSIKMFFSHKSDPASGFYAERSPKGEKSEIYRISNIDRDPFDPNFVRFQLATGVDYMIDIWPLKGNDYSDGLSRRDGVRSEPHMFCLEGNEFMTDEAMARAKVRDLMSRLQGKPRREPFESGVGL